MKKKLWHSCFPVNFANFLRTTFSQNTSCIAVLAAAASFYWPFSHLPFTSLWLASYRYLIPTVFVLQLSYFYDSWSYLPVFYFLFLKLNLFPALHFRYIYIYIYIYIHILCHCHVLTHGHTIITMNIAILQWKGADIFWLINFIFLLV